MDSRRITRPRTRRGWVVLTVVVLVLVGTLAGAAVALSERGEGSAAGVTEQEQRVRVGDEPGGARVTLDVSVFTPPSGAPGAEDRGRRAALVLAHGFGGDKSDLEERARDLAADGYVVLTYTARGFGRSGGRIHLDSPDHEIADVSTLIDVLARRDDVRRDGADDPRVGVAGASYGGAAALMAAGYDDRVDAVVAATTWHDLGRALFPQFATRGERTSPAGLEPIGAPGVFKQRWAARLFAGALGGGTDEDGGVSTQSPPPTGARATPCGRFARDICRLYADAAATGRPGSGAMERLRRSSPGPVLDRIDAPTLLIQGEQDSLFDLTAADANARGIAADGTPVGVQWIDGGHDAATGADRSPGIVTDSMASWFDRHLRGGPEAGPGFRFALPVPARADDVDPERLAAPSYPLHGLSASEEAHLSGAPQRIVAPPGGQPAAATSLPGSGDLGAIGDSAYALAALPGQSATFQTSPLERGHRVVGSPRARLTVTSSAPDATLFVSLWVVAPDGSASLPRNLVAPVRVSGLTPGEPREVEVALPASAYEVESGERLRLVVASTDSAYALPDAARSYRVALAGDGALSLPGVAADPVTDGSEGPLPLAAVVVGVVVVALVLGLLLTRRRRGSTEPGLREVPLVVEGLVKEYPDGLRAVDDVSWRAERGQVIGLLGPNGAGKTTTMRMLVGLIHPDGGRALVLGDEVRAGAPILTRVGALIEGPGFLPHLTGRDNLTAYWAATGRPQEEACLDEVLAVADLGSALDRRVRSYSHGMRQRLGIAQAMLGLPELLLLDEPTNGLDPPQIRAFRDVLQRYADGGRTVVVSSHLLAEVEATCSHVVMMHRGRVVLSGPVGDLLPRAGSVLITLADPGDGTGTDTEGAARAAHGLRSVPGVTETTVDAAGRLRVRGDVSAPELVRTLVEGGFGVAGVDSRHHLEDVFMSLVGDQGTVR